MHLYLCHLVALWQGVVLGKHKGDGSVLIPCLLSIIQLICIFFLGHFLLPSYSPQKVHFLLNIWYCYLIRAIYLEQPLIVLINRRDISSQGRGDAIFI